MHDLARHEKTLPWLGPWHAQGEGCTRRTSRCAVDQISLHPFKAPVALFKRHPCDTNRLPSSDPLLEGHGWRPPMAGRSACAVRQRAYGSQGIRKITPHSSYKKPVPLRQFWQVASSNQQHGQTMPADPLQVEPKTEAPTIMDLTQLQFLDFPGSNNM